MCPCRRRDGGAACAGKDPRQRGGPRLSRGWLCVPLGGRGGPSPRSVSPPLRRLPAHPSSAPVRGGGCPPLPPSPPRRARGEAARPASSCGQRARRSRPPRRTGPWRGREEEAAPCPPLPSSLPSSLPSPPVLAAAPPPACDPLPHVSGEEGRRGAGPSVAAAAAGGGRGGAGAAARRPPAASPLGPAGAPSPPALPMPVWCCRCSLAGHFR